MKSIATIACVAALLAGVPAAQAATAKQEAKSDKESLQIVCKDGTKSEARHLRGACSGHGGVDKKATDEVATKSDKADRQSSSTRALGAGAAKVWGNDTTKVYHCAGDPFYGHTKKGEYMSESEAKTKGFRPDHGKTCAER